VGCLTAKYFTAKPVQVKEAEFPVKQVEVPPRAFEQVTAIAPVEVV
jgi:hypothetical protein